MTLSDVTLDLSHSGLACKPHVNTHERTQTIIIAKSSHSDLKLFYVSEIEHTHTHTHTHTHIHTHTSHYSMYTNFASNCLQYHWVTLHDNMWEYLP